MKDSQVKQVGYFLTCLSGLNEGESMRIYFHLGKTPCVSKQKLSKARKAGRKPGVVKTLHPVAIAALNRINLNGETK